MHRFFNGNKNFYLLFIYYIFIITFFFFTQAQNVNTFAISALSLYAMGYKTTVNVN